LPEGGVSVRAIELTVRSTLSWETGSGAGWRLILLQNCRLDN
jgi:hypothetical protein